jgi:hypothetical protein
VVEAQHLLSTRKLVDTAEEQMLLEEMIEQSKPPAVGGAKLNYLLFTPFRYPPLPHGSRFGSRLEQGIWYGSEALPAAFAEVAYYRLLFLAETRADLGTITTPLTAFSVSARSNRAVDLTLQPFSVFRESISSAVDYAASQALGAAMRASGVQLIRYHSARDPRGGANVAVFSPLAFGSAKPAQMQTWHCTANAERVEMAKRDHLKRQTFSFERAEFLIDGVLPSPAA